jgi:hypothetical protein
VNGSKIEEILTVISFEKIIGRTTAHEADDLQSFKFF